MLRCSARPSLEARQGGASFEASLREAPQDEEVGVALPAGPMMAPEAAFAYI